MPSTAKFGPLVLPAMPPVLISIDEFGAMGGVKRTLAYALLKHPDAPKPVPLGRNTVRYRYDEARAFWESLPTADHSDRAEPAQLHRGRVYKAGELVKDAAPAEAA
jgi:predicted DNA-binding transcriptional regulator AlpA